MKKWTNGILWASALLLTACGTSGAAEQSNAQASSQEPQEVSIGVVGDVSYEIWNGVKERLADDNIELEVVQFTEYIQPNLNLSQGDLDLNAFQHVAYLENFNANNEGTDIEPIGFTFISPLGIYSDKYEDYKEIPDGGEIAIPNDVTNGGRALLLLQAIDLIELDESKGTSVTVADITANPKNLTITELDASHIPRSLPDVEAAIINTNFAVDAGLVPREDALYLDTDNIEKVKEIYKNVVAAREGEGDNEVFQKVVEEYQTEETAQLIDELTKGNDIPAW